MPCEVLLVNVKVMPCKSGDGGGGGSSSSSRVVVILVLVAAVGVTQSSLSCQN